MEFKHSFFSWIGWWIGLCGGYGLGVWMMGGSALGRAKDSVIALGCGVVMAR
jgi:hypothetical protein